MVGIVANDSEVFPDRLFVAVMFAVKISKSVRERRLVEPGLREENAALAIADVFSYRTDGLGNNPKNRPGQKKHSNHHMESRGHIELQRQGIGTQYEKSSADLSHKENPSKSARNNLHLPIPIPQS